MRTSVVFLLASLTALGQERVTVRVDASGALGTLRPVYSFFGYDEPNYTYMKDGQKLLTELAALSPVTVHVRAHNMLTSGDGTAALKWGSTNAYTEDAAVEAARLKRWVFMLTLHIYQIQGGTASPFNALATF